ncbi:MAG TPA: 16S rRNA (adenine(1518)-N(6)/adenine(1519)-N(6))-dimethyltransferase RsmA [archaeon]|nr:16S rRNA (adenine(1518)-N(6)/adenine(1519)-N(6))-dimethyltransferase RsmA [archaeon]
MIKDLYSQMLKYNFKPSHSLDQNFIVDDKVIEKVVELLDIKKTDVILEVGPGTGFLTKHLLEKAKQVIAIEKDKKMFEILKQEFKEKLESKKLLLVNEDILKLNVFDYKFTKIATFLPYSISLQFTEKILNCNCLIVEIVQREFAEKLSSIPGFINYNAISVLTQSYYEVELKKNVSKKCFFPVPAVDSSIVVLKPRKKEFDKRYNDFVKGLFRYPNKDVSNALNLFSRDVKDRSISEKNKNLENKIRDKKIRQIEITELEKIYSIIY